MDAGRRSNGRRIAPSYVETVKALLKKGADVNARAKDGLTALADAEKYGLRNKAEMVCLLNEAGRRVEDDTASPVWSKDSAVVAQRTEPASRR